jgi:hypothetical protein
MNGPSEARISGNEAAAIGSLRAIASAQATFSAVRCNGLYAPNLTTLGATGDLLPNLASADTVESAGYRVTMAAGPSTADQNQQPPCTGAVTAYVASAVPLKPGTSGVRYFRLDQTMAVMHATDASFTDATLLE